MTPVATRRVLQWHKEIALQHRHQERVARVGGKVEAQASQHQPQEGRHSQYAANRAVDAFLGDLYGFGGAALGLLDIEHEHRKDHPRHGGDKERRAPAVEGLAPSSQW